MDVMRAREDCDEQQVRSIKRAARMKIRVSEEEEKKFQLQEELLKEHIKCIISAQSLLK